jgi:hypothetical protein
MTVPAWLDATEQQYGKGAEAGGQVAQKRCGEYQPGADQRGEYQLSI